MEKEFVTEQLRKKWAPVIEHTDMPSISDDYRKNVTAILLENQEQYLKENAPTNSGGAGLAGLASTGVGGDFNKVQGFDPVLISLVRRAMPNLMAYDVCGVQPMNAPTGLIFAMKSKYINQAGDEALFNEARTRFAGGASAAANHLADGSMDPLLTFNDGVVDNVGWARNEV